MSYMTKIWKCVLPKSDSILLCTKIANKISSAKQALDETLHELPHMHLVLTNWESNPRPLFATPSSTNRATRVRVRAAF
jgi:hypothetical protein